jgi:uncharacterized protein involved in exopolysaccharide biosynthesis
MKKRVNRHRSLPYSAQQLSGLLTSTTARKQETVKRLKAAIESLNAKGQPITVQTIYAECGLHYSTYVRNEEAIALFRANSTHLAQRRKPTKRKLTTDGDAPPPFRDPLMHYKKPQLVSRLREAERTIQQLEQQLAHVTNEYLEQDACIVELKAKLTELEPYRTFVEQVRQRVRDEEHGGSTS